MTAGSRDRHHNVDISLLSDAGDSKDRAPYFGEPTYKRDKCELRAIDNHLPSAHCPRPRGARKSLRHTFSIILVTDFQHPVRTESGLRA